jgi:phosphoserine phosphatase RsbU/P
MMAVLRAALAAHQVFGRSRKFVSQDLNQIVNAVGVPGVFVTAFFVSLEFSTGEMYCGNCGHPPALLRRADGRVEPLVGIASLPIGMVEEIDAPLFIAQLQPGDALILFTDGITEARNAAGEFFDDVGLHLAIRNSGCGDAENLLQNITAALRQHTGEIPPSDDRCVLICTRNPDS